MATLKKKQAEKDSGEWESLSDQAQQQVLATLNLSQVVVFINHPFDRSSSALCHTIPYCACRREGTNSRLTVGQQIAKRLLTSYPWFVWVLENLESPGILWWHFPGLESPGKWTLLLESSGNLLNSAKKSMKCMEGSKENYIEILGL